MTELDRNLAYGIFEPPALKDMAEAFEKAERHLDQLSACYRAEIDRDRVACFVVAEARAGETHPELVWRAAVAKFLLALRAGTPAGSGQEPGDDFGPATGRVLARSAPTRTSPGTSRPLLPALGLAG
jgi:hypothetical protein